MKTLRTKFVCNGKACTVTGSADAIREYLKDLKAKGKRVTINGSRASANAPLMLDGVEQLRLSSYEDSDEAEGPIPPRFSVNKWRKERGLPAINDTQSYHGAADFDSDDDDEDEDNDALGQIRNFEDDDDEDFAEGLEDDDGLEALADEGSLVPPTFNREKWLASKR